MGTADRNVPVSLLPTLFLNLHKMSNVYITHPYLPAEDVLSSCVNLQLIVHVCYQKIAFFINQVPFILHGHRVLT